MAQMVNCVVLKREAEGLDRAPYPGDIGERILANVSREGWQEWLVRLQMIINEYQMNTADPRTLEVIEQHMLGFLFGEGELGAEPQGFRAGGGKK